MIRIKKIKPMFTSIVTTMDKYESDALNAAGIIETTKTQGTIKEYQKVLAVGTAVRDIKVGDMVQINPSRYEVRKYPEGSMKDNVITHNTVIGYNFPIIEIDGNQCLLLQDRDIDFVIEEYEKVNTSNNIKINEVKNNIILPKNNIITC